MWRKPIKFGSWKSHVCLYGSGRDDGERNYRGLRDKWYAHSFSNAFIGRFFFIQHGPS